MMERQRQTTTIQNGNGFVTINDASNDHYSYKRAGRKYSILGSHSLSRSHCCLPHNRLLNNTYTNIQRRHKSRVNSCFYETQQIKKRTNDKQYALHTHKEIDGERKRCWNGKSCNTTIPDKINQRHVLISDLCVLLIVFSYSIRIMWMLYDYLSSVCMYQYRFSRWQLANVIRIRFITHPRNRVEEQKHYDRKKTAMRANMFWIHCTCWVLLSVRETNQSKSRLQCVVQCLNPRICISLMWKCTIISLLRIK